MTRPTPWDAGLTGWKYQAASALHHATRHGQKTGQLAQTLNDAHAVGLDRTQIAAILTDADPSIPADALTRAGRYPRTRPTRPSFDTQPPDPPVEDGPGPWPPYITLCHQLRAQLRPAGPLTAHQAIRIAQTHAPTTDPTLAATICAAELTGHHQGDPMTHLRFHTALDLWWEHT